MSCFLTDAQVSELHELFASIDRDKDGTISFEEFAVVARAACKGNLTDQEIFDMLAEGDVGSRGSDGRIDFEVCECESVAHHTCLTFIAVFCIFLPACWFFL